ncbi:MAG: hypothetical protein ACQESP_06495, partial [Candidatus Muiribacteriota bacterium]
KEFTIKDICEKIWELEQKYDLFSLNDNRVPLWEIIRFNIYKQVTCETGLYKEAQHSKKTTFDKFLYFPKIVYWTLFYNPFLCLKKVNYIVIEHGRKIEVDKKKIDIYTYYFTKKLSRNEVSYECYDWPYSNMHNAEYNKKRKYLDLFRVAGFIGKYILSFSLSCRNKEIFLKVENEINKFFNINIDLIPCIKKSAKKFKINYYFFKKLFKIKKPEKLFILESYGEFQQAAVKAAKDSGIKAIEFQHGAINNYHMGYSFPGLKNNSLKCFPDKIFVWDDIWKRICENFPLSQNNLINCGFDYLKYQKKKFNKINKKDNQILIISQGTLTAEISSIIIKNINSLQKYKIIYKLHPGEYERWKNCNKLVQLSEFDNVKVIDNNKIHLYKLLKESKYVIGAYSTVIFEALFFDCRIFLLELPGVKEFMKKFFEEKNIKLIKDDEKIINFLK